MLILNASVVIVVGSFFLANEHGPVRRYLDRIIASRATAALIESSWPALSGSGALYSASAGPDTLVIFSDYQCPYCRQLHAQLSGVASVRTLPAIRYRHFPLPSHRLAMFAARAAICAERVGEFAEVHEHLMVTSEWMEVAEEQAESMLPVTDKLNFRSCIESELPTQVLAEDARLVQALGLQGTPSIISKGRIRVGVLDQEELLQLGSQSPRPSTRRSTR